MNYYNITTQQQPQPTITLDFSTRRPTLKIFSDASGAKNGGGGACIPGLNKNIYGPLVTPLSKDMSDTMARREWEMIYHVLRLIKAGSIPGFGHIVIKGKPFWQYICEDCNIIIYTDNQPVVRIFNEMLTNMYGGKIFATDETICKLTAEMVELRQTIPYILGEVRAHTEDHILIAYRTYHGWANAIADDNCNGLPENPTCIVTHQGFQFSDGIIGHKHHVSTEVPTDSAAQDIYYAMNPHLRRIPKFNFNFTATDFTI